MFMNKYSSFSFGIKVPGGVLFFLLKIWFISTICLAIKIKLTSSIADFRFFWFPYNAKVAIRTDLSHYFMVVTLYRYA